MRNEILTKIEMKLGYVEMGKKSVNERVDAILAEIGEMKKTFSIAMTTRKEKN